jgi:CheY-like chemotaxis protein
MKKVILIDDDPINNLITKRKLLKYNSGIELQIFETAVSAIKFFNSNAAVAPDLILLDINMPEISGWDFLDQLQSFLVNIPIVIYTSSIDEVDREKAKNYPMIKEYIIKPLNDEKTNLISKLL